MNFANKITIFRILLVPVFIAFLLYSKFQIALMIFILAAISDGVDGFVARHFNQKTALGAILDPIADKILIVSAFISLIFIKALPHNIVIPPYVPIIVIFRDVIIVLGVMLIYILKGNIEIKPTYIGKITTFLQMLTIAFILMQLKYSPLVWNVAVITTVISGVEYIRWGTKILGEKA